MKTLTSIIRQQVLANFINLETAIRTYDRNALVCGAAAWRYVYHTIHSADKWFINPSEYQQPSFHSEGLDNPDIPSDVVLSDNQLLEYLHSVLLKTNRYLDTLDDEMLGEKPRNCKFTRLELVLGQFRHISFHTGMINGQTTERTGKFPVYVGLEKSGFNRLKNGLYEE